MRELIGICLRKNPDARYADGEELAAATVLVSEGQRPPQPHRVPAVEDFGDHPLTEQLGAVAHGPGTRVPPMQGRPWTLRHRTLLLLLDATPAQQLPISTGFRGSWD